MTTAPPSTLPDASLPAPGRSPRVRALDGLRGITIVLVVVNHASGAVWPREAVDRIPVLRSIFGGGSVTLFFVVGGFIVTRNLLADRDRGSLDGVLFLARRVVRLWAHLVPLAAVLLVWQWWDTDFVYDQATTLRSIVGALTFTINLVPYTDVRGDVWTLWYLGVQQQWYLVLPLLLLVLGRRRAVVVGAFALAFVLVTVERYRVLADVGWVEASVGTFTRSDGLVLGVALGAAMPYLERRTGWARVVLPVSALLGLGLLAVLHEFDDPFLFLKWWGVAFTLVCGALIVAVVVAPADSFTTRVLSVAPLERTGRASLALFVWHMPVLLAVQVYLANRPWYVQTGAVVVALVAIAAFSERYLDGPVRTWLRTNLRPDSRAREAVPA